MLVLISYSTRYLCSQVSKYLFIVDEVSQESVKPKQETNNKENSMSSRIESLTIQEDVKEGEAEDDEGLPIYPYDRLKTTSTDAVSEIDVTKREVKILDGTVLS